MPASNELVELVRVSSLELIALLSANRDDPLVGFALCTDDDVSCLLPAGCTVSVASASEDPDILFMPCDWPDLDVRTHDAFERIVDVFLQRSPDNLWTREADFNLVVDGLAAARATGKVEESVFLTVMSSDPCEHMSNLEERALPLLNPPHIVRRWYQWRFDIARSYLLELRSRPAPLSYADQDQIERCQSDLQRFHALLNS